MYWSRHGVACIKGTLWIDSSIPNDASMRPSNIQWMFQIMACRLIGTNTISELMLICASIELFRTHFSKISIEIHKFSVRKTCFKMPVQWRPFCLGCSMCWVCLRANIGIICNRISCSPANNVVICKSKSHLLSLLTFNEIHRNSELVKQSTHNNVWSSTSYKSWQTVHTKLTDAFTSCKIGHVTLLVIIGTSIWVR